MNRDRKQVNRGKMIPLRDFLYLAVILCTVVVCIITMTLSDSTKAGENLNFAATLTSIILAVLAIVITLVESVSQKENLQRLEELSNELDESVKYTKNVINNTYEKSEEHVKTIINLKEELKTHYESSIQQLKDNLYHVVDNSQNISKDEIDKIFKKSMKEITGKLSKESTQMKNYELGILVEYIFNKLDLKDDVYISQEEVKMTVRNALNEIGFESGTIMELEVMKVIKELENRHDVYYSEGKGYALWDLPF